MTTATNTNGHRSNLTPSPTSAINWDFVGFKVHKVNGHAHATWSNGKWGKPEFRTEEALQIHGFAPCLNYGQVSLPNGFFFSF
jgi:branched-chain amino acid aminotransferase